MLSFISRADRCLDPLRGFAARFVSPVLDLAIRFVMASYFFSSGILKWNDYSDGHWGNVVRLFRDIHPVPGIAPEAAAVMATGAELLLPVLLLFGLFTRFAAAGLLMMTIVIQFVVPAEYGVRNPDHYMWMLLLAVPLVKGPGALSIDHVILRWIRRGENSSL